jgi:GTPase SAR1 family protein
MQLPTSKTPAERKDPRYILLYGPPKVGKTTILSQLEDNLIIDLENGTELMEALKIKPTSIADYRKICEMICAKQPRPYKYVSIDTVDKLEEWAEELATLNYKASNVGKNFMGKSVLFLPNGAGYLWLRDAFAELMQLAYPLARSVIFVGHVRDKMLESQGREVSSKDLNLTGKVRTIMCSLVDAIGYVTRDKEGNLGVNFKTSETIACGSRCQHLMGQSFWFEGNKFDWKKIFID